MNARGRKTLSRTQGSLGKSGWVTLSHIVLLSLRDGSTKLWDFCISPNLNRRTATSGFRHRPGSAVVMLRLANDKSDLLKVCPGMEENRLSVWIKYNLSRQPADCKQRARCHYSVSVSSVHVYQRPTVESHCMGTESGTADRPGHGLSTRPKRADDCPSLRTCAPQNRNP